MDAAGREDVVGRQRGVRIARGKVHAPAEVGDDVTVAVDGDDRGVALDDVAAAPGPGEQRALHLVDDGPDHVGGVQGLAGGRANLGHDDESVGLLAGDGHEHQEVGEAEVGEEPPRHRETAGMDEVLTDQFGVADCQLVEHRHNEDGTCRLHVGSAHHA